MCGILIKPTQCIATFSTHCIHSDLQKWPSDSSTEFFPQAPGTDGVTQTQRCATGAEDFSPEAVINRALIGAAHYTNEQQHTLAHYCVDCADVFLGCGARFEVDYLRWVVQIGVGARGGGVPVHLLTFRKPPSESFCHWSVSHSLVRPPTLLLSVCNNVRRASSQFTPKWCSLCVCVRGAAALSAAMNCVFAAAGRVCCM